MSEKADSQEKSTDSKPEKPADSKPASNNFESERTQARKVVQGFTQSLIQWMPLGGSGAAFISFVLKSEWLLAVLMFPVMAVTVVWVAYTEAVLTRLREISAEQGKKDVNSFVAWLGEVNQAIRWQLAGVEDKYLRCQGSACQDYETELHFGMIH